MKDLFVFVCMCVLPASLYVHEVSSSPPSAPALSPSSCEWVRSLWDRVCLYGHGCPFCCLCLQNTRIKGVHHHAWHVCAHTQTQFSLRGCLMYPRLQVRMICALLILLFLKWWGFRNVSVCLAWDCFNFVSTDTTFAYLYLHLRG